MPPARARHERRWHVLRSAILAIPLGLLAVGQPISAPHPAGTQSTYVGSQACAKCHASIYQSYARTDMGRSMSEINPSLPLLQKLATPVSLFDPRLDRHFEVYVKDGTLYQSEFQTAAGGQEVFRDVHGIDWIIGSGANGLGGIIKRGDYLFEAPLSFYARKQTWGLSPGYEFYDYGFNRPILPACIACHSGQPNPVLGGNGRFLEPPFTELAIGCENCHGPGEQHALEMQLSSSAESTSSSIVNPAKLSPWVANNICMSCHQIGDARVLRPGKTYRDFHPGDPLEQTLSVFMVPFSRESAPKDDLLEHYLSMRLSKCYQGSRGRLSCISCHDPHVQPTPQEAPSYFRPKCLACHTQKSCAVPQPLRQRGNPPDDCAGCHMPKRSVAVISHTVLTNHRIVATAEEPFPDAAFHMTSPLLPDLVQLNADPGATATPSPLTLLEAYGQVLGAHPEYRERYWALARQLEVSERDRVIVLEALADWSLQKKNNEGASDAVTYLSAAIEKGSSTPADFEQLATLLLASRRHPEAIRVLQNGIALVPYDPELYELMAKAYRGSDKAQAACEILDSAVQKFPQHSGLREMRKGCTAAAGTNAEGK